MSALTLVIIFLSFLGGFILVNVIFFIASKISEAIAKRNLRLTLMAQFAWYCGASVEEILAMKLPRKLRKALEAAYKQEMYEQEHDPFPEYRN